MIGYLAWYFGSFLDVYGVYWCYREWNIYALNDFGNMINSFGEPKSPMKLLIKFPTKCTFIQAHRAWLPKFLVLWILLMALIGCFIYSKIDVDTKVWRTEVLGSLCDQRARMLQDQFSVNVNHVHALAILVSTFHYYRTPSAIDQVCLCFIFPILLWIWN